MSTSEKRFSNDLYLAIDQGGHASRAIVFNNTGEIIAQAHRNLAIQRFNDNFVEHDPQELLLSINEAVEKVIKQLGDKAKTIAVAGLATQRSNVVCWNKITGEALSPVISWQDVREHQWLKSLKSQAQTIHHRTGLFLSPHYGASKLRWCLQNIEAVQKAKQKNELMMGPMASFILYHLAEEQPLVADPSNASRTQLWDLIKKDWHPELLALFDIDAELLPNCVPSNHSFGTLKVSGLSIPIQLCMGDQSAAMYAYGTVQPDTAYVNTGTGAFVSRPSGYAMLYGRRLLTSVIYQNKNQSHYVLEGTINGAGSAIDFVSKELKLDNVLDNLGEWLHTTRNGHDNDFKQLYLNGISGLGAPFWVADFQSRFVHESNDKDKIVAVVESIIFLIRENINEMQKLASPPEQIQITGGLTIQDEICQRLADLTELAVYRPVECEATARGLAYKLAGEPKIWPEKEVGEWFKPKINTGLQARYKEWNTALLKALRD
ncbi:Glycerol kinase [hydrothermal vent metagenome]|uniref:Glycerol kinase n=1 Tax=hydrothermal vent metagenome TaxID=652676 RepID=A0A3B0ZSN6_9ZZZZ